MQKSSFFCIFKATNTNRIIFLFQTVALFQTLNLPAMQKVLTNVPVKIVIVSNAMLAPTFSRQLGFHKITAQNLLYFTEILESFYSWHVSRCSICKQNSFCRGMHFKRRQKCLRKNIWLKRSNSKFKKIFRDSKLYLIPFQCKAFRKSVQIWNIHSTVRQNTVIMI